MAYTSSRFFAVRSFQVVYLVKTCKIQETRHHPPRTQMLTRNTWYLVHEYLPAVGCRGSVDELYDGGYRSSRGFEAQPGTGCKGLFTAVSSYCCLRCNTAVTVRSAPAACQACRSKAYKKRLECAETKTKTKLETWAANPCTSKPFEEYQTENKMKKKTWGDWNKLLCVPNAGSDPSPPSP